MKGLQTRVFPHDRLGNAVAPQLPAIGECPRVQAHSRRNIAGVTSRIVSLVAAEPGWRAIYFDEDDENRELTRIVAWALVEDDGTQDLIGLVIDSNDPTRIVPAPEGGSATAPRFDRYGFKED